MKVRIDFVTNSSSASYVVSCCEILDKEKLKEWLAVEYGNFANKILDRFIVKGKGVLEEKDSLINSYFFCFDESDFADIDPDKEYIFVWEDIQGGNPVAAIAANLRHPRLLKHIFYDSWSGYDG
jgi:hypothetical protein